MIGLYIGRRENLRQLENGDRTDDRGLELDAVRGTA